MSTAAAILVTGATGNVGARVVRGLLERGVRPRIFVRDAAKARQRFGESVEMVVGDLGDAASLAEALRGMERVFLVNAGPDLAARDELAAGLACRAGVRCVVKLSTMDAEQGVGTGVWHRRGEDAIRASGLPFTCVRPAGFMDNALAWGAAIRSDGVVEGATGEGRIAFVHPQDIAAVAATVLTSDGYRGQTLALTGPEALSYGQMVERIGAALGKALRFVNIPEDVERQRWTMRGEPPDSVRYHLDIFRAIREGRLAGVTDTVQRVLGRAPLSFDRWVRENLAAFSPAAMADGEADPSPGRTA